MKIVDELRQIVCASADLTSSLADLRTKYIAALAVGCRLDRVDRTIGGPPLKVLIAEAGDGPVHRARSSTNAATRDVAVKELSAASDEFRRQVIDAMVRQVESDLEATRHVAQPWLSEFNALTNAMATGLDSMLAWRVATGERVPAHPEFVRGYDGLKDLSARITSNSNTLRPRVSRTLAATGTPLIRIGEVVGGNARSFGYRYRDWRTFGRRVWQTDPQWYVDQRLQTIGAIISSGDSLESWVRSAIRGVNVEIDGMNRTFFAP